VREGQLGLVPPLLADIHGKIEGANLSKVYKLAGSFSSVVTLRLGLISGRSHAIWNRDWGENEFAAAPARRFRATS
jgi:hypothetical protein